MIVGPVLARWVRKRLNPKRMLLLIVGLAAAGATTDVVSTLHTVASAAGTVVHILQSTANQSEKRNE